MHLISTDPVWINSAEDLADFCKKWQQQAAIAIDTEFMRSDTFYPKVGLLQIGDGKGCYLIDPLLIKDVQPLRELLLNPNIVKVLHSCSEDLEVFQTWLNLIPNPIFDTQIAAAFAGFGYSLSYANLVRLLLNTEIPKDETRSDWLQRPLSLAQLKYAALDVAHMLIVYGKLLVQLKASERLSWVKSDCADLVIKASTLPDYSAAYKDVGLAWKLRPQELFILRDLAIWREEQSRERNIPRNRLIKETAMWEIARKKIVSLSELEKVEDLPSRTLRNDAEFLLSLVRSGLDSSIDQWPQRLEPPLSPEHGPVIKAMKEAVREIAEQHQLPAEILIRKKDYEFIVRSKMHSGEYQLPERLKGWRFNLIGEKLLEVVKMV
ncbi:MAG: ribonuclease D [Cellvibrio sp.]|nr:ribonuclease D [Cellvibrio sp.]